MTKKKKRKARERARETLDEARRSGEVKVARTDVTATLDLALEELDEQHRKQTERVRRRASSVTNLAAVAARDTRALRSAHRAEPSPEVEDEAHPSP